MPELYFKVAVVGGKPAIQELESLDRTYQKVGTSGTKTFQSASHAASVFGNRLGSITDIVSGLAVSFGGLQIASQISHWTASLVDFEVEFAKVTTLFEDSVEGYEKLRKQLLAISGDFGSNTNLAKGLFATIQAGISKTDAIEFLTQALYLQETAFIDVSSAVQVLKVSLNAYSKTTADAADTAETLFRILRTGGGMDVVEFTRALGRIAPVAAGLKVELADVGAMIATLKTQGIAPMQAITMLTTLMTKMSTEGTKLNKAIKDLGVNISATRIKQEGFGAVIADLGDVIRGDTELVMELGIQGRQMGAFLSLAGSGADKYKAKLKELSAEGFLMKAAFDLLQNTVGDKWNDLINNAERSMAKLVGSSNLAKGALDFLNRVITEGIPWVNALTAAVIGLTLAFGTQSIVGFISQLTALQGAIAGVQLLAMVRSFADLRVAMSALTMGLNPLLMGLGLLAGAIIVYKDEIADATVETLRFLGVAERMPGVTGMNERALDRMAGTLNVSTSTLRKWMAEYDNAGLILGKYRLQINRLSEEVEAHRITQEQYERAIEKLIKRERERGESVDDLVDKITRGKGLTEDETRRLAALAQEMEKAKYPAAELAANLALLKRAGKDTSDFARIFSRQIVEAAEASKLFGNTLPRSIAAMLPAATAFEEMKARVKALTEAQQKLDEVYGKEFPQAVSQLQNLELVPNAEELVPYVALQALLSGKVADQTEAYKYAVEWLKKYDELVSKNKANLREQLAAWEDQHSMMALLAKDYETLGVSLDKSLTEVAAAYERLKASGLASAKVLTDAVSNAARAAIEQFQPLPGAMAAELEQMAFSTDRAIRDRMLPVWMDYQRSLRDINGQLAPDAIDALHKVYTGTDMVLKKQLLPLWDEYVEACRDLNGQLPPALDKLNQKIVKDMERSTGKLAEVWKSQISTIFTDFSRGVADIIFEGKSMTETLTGIFKEFGKMVVRTLIEAMFDPIKKMLSDLVDLVFKQLNKTATTVADSMAGMATGALSAVGKTTSTATRSAAGGFTMGTSVLAGSAFEPKAGEFGNIFAGGSYNAATSAAAAEAAATQTGAAVTKGLFGLPKGGIKGHGVGGTAGALMTTAGTLLALDSLQRSGLAGYLEGAGGGALAGYALGGWQGALTGGGAMLMAKGLQGHGGGSWAASIGGGALAGAGIGTMIMPGIGTAIGAAIGALVGAVGKVVQAIKGKSTELAGVMEAARDLGGIKIDTSVFKSYFEELGLTSATAEGIRKDLTMAPKFLTEIAGPAAKAQGQMEAFLTSLEKVETAWGTFDFREAYELGDLTGDWTALDKAFVDAFEHSQALQQNLPGWRDALSASGESVKETARAFWELNKEFVKTGDISDELIAYLEENKDALDEAAKSSKTFADALDKARVAAEKWKGIKDIVQNLKALRDAIVALDPKIKDMYATFLDTGEITEELRNQLSQYTRHMEEFERFAMYSKLNNYFEELCQTFRETGEILPDLRQMFKDFGGDLKVLDDAAKLSSLKQLQTDITDFASGLNSILPELSPLQKILEGIWDQDMWDKLIEMGFDPSKFVKITDLIKYEKGWESAVEDFYNKTEKVWDPIKQKFIEKWAGLEKGGLIEQGLYTYGGEEGRRALERYYSEGVNTISPAMLKKVKDRIDTEFKSERSTLLEYLKGIQESTKTEIETLTKAVTDQFAIVGKNLADKWEQARKDVVDRLDIIIDIIKNGVATSRGTGTGTSTAMPYPEGYTGRTGVNYGESPGTETRTGILRRIAAAAAGGAVIQSGLAYVHKNEYIVPETAARAIIVGPGGAAARTTADGIPMAATGGYVNQTGLAVVHQNELIVSAKELEQYNERNPWGDRNPLADDARFKWDGSRWWDMRGSTPQLASDLNMLYPGGPYDVGTTGTPWWWYSKMSPGLSDYYRKQFGGSPERPAWVDMPHPGSYLLQAGIKDPVEGMRSWVNPSVAVGSIGLATFLPGFDPTKFIGVAGQSRYSKFIEAAGYDPVTGYRKDLNIPEYKKPTVSAPTAPKTMSGAGGAPSTNYVSVTEPGSGSRGEQFTFYSAGVSVPAAYVAAAPVTGLTRENLSQYAPNVPLPVKSANPERSWPWFQERYGVNQSTWDWPTYARIPNQAPLGGTDIETMAQFRKKAVDYLERPWALSAPSDWNAEATWIYSGGKGGGAAAKYPAASSFLFAGITDPKQGKKVNVAVPQWAMTGWEVNPLWSKVYNKTELDSFVLGAAAAGGAAAGGGAGVSALSGPGISGGGWGTYSGAERDSVQRYAPDVAAISASPYAVQMTGTQASASRTAPVIWVDPALSTAARLPSGPGSLLVNPEPALPRPTSSLTPETRGEWMEYLASLGRYDLQKLEASYGPAGSWPLLRAQLGVEQSTWDWRKYLASPYVPLGGTQLSSDPALNAKVLSYLQAPWTFTYPSDWNAQSTWMYANDRGGGTAMKYPSLTSWLQTSVKDPTTGTMYNVRVPSWAVVPDPWEVNPVWDQVKNGGVLDDYVSVPQAATGGLVEQTGAAFVHKGEIISPAPAAEISRATQQERLEAQEEVHMHFEGATFYGFQDFEQQVADAWQRRWSRGGFRETVRNR